jgi:hypothetical protein
MTGETSKPEGTFGSFLELIRSEPTFPPPAEQCTTPDEMEESIVQLLTLLKGENGAPILVEDLYNKSELNLQLFGEALQVMYQEGLVIISDDGQVAFAPGVQEQL